LILTQEENGGAGVYSADLRKHYSLKDPAWRHDIMPEIIEGHNVIDFVDPEIEALLQALDKEEEAMAAKAALQVGALSEFRPSSTSS
jgi:nucleolar GTP-binding protein